MKPYKFIQIRIKGPKRRLVSARFCLGHLFSCFFFTDHIFIRIPERRKIRCPVFNRCLANRSRRIGLIGTVIVFFNGIWRQLRRSAQNGSRNEFSRRLCRNGAAVLVVHEPVDGNTEVVGNIKDHTLYHLEGLDYEGNSIAYLDTPEHIVIRKEEVEHIRNTLTLLTETQQRRLWMLSENMTMREIAAADGISVSAVKESLDTAKNNFQKNF